MSWKEVARQRRTDDDTRECSPALSEEEEMAQRMSWRDGATTCWEGDDVEGRGE
jgi:hypothetical protein